MCRRMAICVGCLIGLLAGASAWREAGAVAAPASAGSESGGSAVVIPIRGVINDFTQQSFEKRLGQARALGARTIIVELDTPGGMVGPAMEISRRIRGLDDLHVIAYVNDMAFSAGTMIAIACDEIAMKPGAMLGDCAVIAVKEDSTIEPLPDTERGKAESPVLADFRESARVNGYSQLLVDAMVRIKPSVYLVHNAKTSEHRAVDEAGYKDLLAGGDWKDVEGVHQPVDDPATLLTVPSSIAMKLGLARSEANSVAELAGSRGLSIVATLEPGKGEQLLALLNGPILRAILLSLFLTCFYVALHAPGHGMAEVLAVVLLAVLVGVPLLTGHAQWWEVIAILVGVALLALELFVIPGFGVAGILGALLIVGGLLMTFVAPEPGRSPMSVPSLPVTWAGLRNGMMVLIAGVLGAVLMSAWVRRYLPKIPYFRRMLLTTPVGAGATAMAGSLTNIDPMDLHPAIGATGKAVTDLKPGGTAEFRDSGGNVHAVNVVSDGHYVPRGSMVTVLEVAGNRIVVADPARMTQRGTQRGTQS